MMLTLPQSYGDRETEDAMLKLNVGKHSIQRHKETRRFYLD